MKSYILFFAALFFISFSFCISVCAQERYVTVSDGTKLYVKTSGKGEPCLFVHGGPGQGSVSFEQMRGNELEASLTMIYLDQRGSGKSGSSANYTLDRMVKDIEEVRKALGYKKLNLLAHSFGGVIAVNYAKKYPKHMSRLILANATLHFYSDETLKQQIRFAATLVKKDFPIDEKISRTDLEKLLDDTRRELNKTDITYKIFTENVETIQKMIRIDREAQRNHDFGRAVMTETTKFAEYYADYAPISSKIKIPVLVLTGTTDHAVGPDHYKTFQFPKQTTKIIPGAHMPYYDNTQLFVQSINSFIKSN